jgi:hypothetical protein
MRLPQAPSFLFRAGVAELVDATDLKSVGIFSRASSSLATGTIIKKKRGALCPSFLF